MSFELCGSRLALGASLLGALVTWVPTAHADLPAAIAISEEALAPATPALSALPAATAAERFDEQPVSSLPMGSWNEATASCRVLTTFRSSGQGCEAGMRHGDIAYFHAGVGFFSTPQFERYVRYYNRASTTPLAPEQVQNTSTTIIDPTRASVYYLSLGPGLAVWPTRLLNIHFELGGFVGSITNPASLALQTSDETSIALGAFAGAGTSFRLPSRPWAIGFDYRVTTVPYGGLGSGEEPVDYGVQVGHALFGFAHSFSISAILRFEDDRSN